MLDQGFATRAERWRAACDEGLELARDYVSSHAFVHDDLWKHLPDDFDELSAHPTLYHAPVVVTSRQLVAANSLKSTNSTGAQQVIRTPGRSPLEVLAASTAKREELARLVVSNRLHLSAFYSDRSELLTLQSAAEELGWKPQIHPDPAQYSAYAHHAENLSILRGLVELFPQSRVCNSATEAFGAFVELGPEVFVKGIDSSASRANTAARVEEIATDEGFPIVIQKAIPATSSPTLQWISWKGAVRPLFIADQLLRNSHHVGNVYSQRREEQIAIKYWELLILCMNTLDGWQGVAGMDFLEDSQSRTLIPVDLNARFNSSTFPILHGLESRNEGRRDIVYRRHVLELPLEQVQYALENNSQSTHVNTKWFGGSVDGSDNVTFSLTVDRDEISVDQINANLSAAMNVAPD
ncbi:hypothetical protein [Subtercola lobariae]|nr:hypothetical protein [Subtercola lobariae]